MRRWAEHGDEMKDIEALGQISLDLAERLCKGGMEAPGPKERARVKKQMEALLNLVSSGAPGDARALAEEVWLGVLCNASASDEPSMMELSKILVDLGANPNVRDGDGWTALHQQACFGRENLCAVLVSLGVCSSVATPKGHTFAEENARDNGHRQLGDFLQACREREELLKSSEPPEKKCRWSVMVEVAAGKEKSHAIWVFELPKESSDRMSKGLVESSGRDILRVVDGRAAATPLSRSPICSGVFKALKGRRMAKSASALDPRIGWVEVDGDDELWAAQSLTIGLVEGESLPSHEDWRHMSAAVAKAARAKSLDVWDESRCDRKEFEKLRRMFAEGGWTGRLDLGDDEKSALKAWRLSALSHAERDGLDQAIAKSKPAARKSPSI